MRDGNALRCVLRSTEPSPVLHRQTDRTGADLRRPGRDRDRERRLFDEVQAAHARSHRVARAANRDLRSAGVSSAVRPVELNSVFEKMLENATRVCGAQFGTMNLYDGERFNVAGGYNVPPAFADRQLHVSFVRSPQERPGHGCEDASTGPYRGYPDASPLSRAQSRGGRALRPRRRANARHRPDAQGR